MTSRSTSSTASAIAVALALLLLSSWLLLSERRVSFALDASVVPARHATSDTRAFEPSSDMAAPQRVSVPTEASGSASAADRASRAWFVYDLLSEAPIPGVRVRWEDLQGRAIQCGVDDADTTDAEGAAPAPPLESARVQLEHPEYLPRDVDVADIDAARGRLGLYPRAELRVWVTDSSGVAVEGARVDLGCDAPHLSGQERRRIEVFDSIGATSAAGMSRCEGLPRGQRVRLLVDGEPHATRMSAASPLTELRITLEPRAELRGRFVRHTDGAALAGLPVRLERRGAADRSVRTDADGSWRFERVALGASKLAVDWPGAHKESLFVRESGLLDIGTRVLPATGRLSGRVQTPLPSLVASTFTVCVWRSGACIASTAPATDGAFAFELPLGEVTVGLCIGNSRTPLVSRAAAVPDASVLLSVESTNVAAFRVPDSAWSCDVIALRAGATANTASTRLGHWFDIKPIDDLLVLPIGVEEPVDLTILVAGRGGAHVSACRPAPLHESLVDPPLLQIGWGALVLEDVGTTHAEHGAGEQVVLRRSFGADSRSHPMRGGRAEIERIAPGRMLATLQRSDGVPRFAESVLVSAGATTHVRTRASVECSLSGRVTGVSRAPGEDVILSWIDAPAYWRAPIDDLGAFAFTGLPSGSFSLGLPNDARLQLELAPGERAHLECALEPTVDIGLIASSGAVTAIENAQLLTVDSGAAHTRRTFELRVLDGGTKLRVPRVEHACVLRVSAAEAGRSTVAFALLEPTQLAAGEVVRLGSESIECEADPTGAELPAARLLLDSVGAFERLRSSGWTATPQRRPEGWRYDGIPAGARLVLDRAGDSTHAWRFRATGGVVVEADR